MLNWVMDACVKYVKEIDTVFQSIYVDRSIVICKSLSTMYGLSELLSKLDFPIATLTIFDSKTAMTKYMGGMARMLIMSEAMAHVTKQYMPQAFDLANVLFVVEGVEMSVEEFSEYESSGKQIIFLP